MKYKNLNEINFKPKRYSTIDITNNKTLLVINLSFIIILFFSLGFRETYKVDYGPWRTTSCFSGLDFRVKKGSFNESARKYEWWVNFRNRYKVDVSFNCVLKESNVVTAKGTDRVTVHAGEEGGDTWFLVADANSVNLFVNSLRYGSDDWGTPYAKCDN